MKKIIFYLLFIIPYCGFAQNVGINTTTPQASLDVRGSQRTGGISNYIKYDSATGKIEWVGASLFTPVSQQIIRHSASSEGLYAGGGKLDYRNSSGIPVFYSDWTNGNGYFAGDMGIGTSTPQHKLHLFTGVSGTSAPNGYNLLALESSGNINMSFLTSDAGQSTIWFSKPSQQLGGGIFYNNVSAPDGFIFRANNAPRLVITNLGRIGIGTNSPGAPVHILDGGGSGGTPFTFTRLAVDGSGHTYINLLSPDANETAILFGKASNAASGVIMYNNASTPNGFQFRNNGNLTRMVVDNAGNVGIGTITPQYPLDINGRMRLSGTNPFDPGIWLNDAGAERAFIGLQNNNQVGFYGVGGINWGFTMNTLTGALAVNGNYGNAGQILQSNGSGAAPVWINPVDPAAYKTQYYKSPINSVVLTNAASSLSINVPVTVYANSIITVSVTVNVSTANFGGCTSGELSLSIEPLGGGGLIATAGKFQTICGATANSFTTGELPLLASDGSMKVFGPGTGIGAIVRFVKTNTGPDLTIGNTSPAVIIVKVVPQ